MTAPEPRSTGMDSNARGLAVIVVAVVVGLLLLANAGGGGGGTDAATDGTPVDVTDLTDPTSTATTESTTTSTTPVASGRAPSEVKVLVLNGGGPSGAAGSTSSTIGNAGYTMGEAANSPVTVETTTFFYAEDYQSEATAIALLLGKSPDALEPLVDAGLGGAEGDANVVVVLGPDTPPVSTTTVPAAGN